ncbi:MAG: histidine kinase dimerization/phosphoacceptor domain -containing protein [Euryarchaeota archaeon]|nr:histidine kinase dimerization/phosphoacceptor domain -containing protein [Euryarchaeota archaeon]
MLEKRIGYEYYSLLQSHFVSPQEGHLVHAAELGRELVIANIPPEEIAELHEDAVRRLGIEFPETKLIAAANLISQPLTELLMAYGLSFRERLDEQKRSEDRIKASLNEKEVLLREIHHRVKNNLQVILSLLDMQARSAKDKNVKDALSESINRVYTMSLIHNQLYESENLSEVNMRGFVDNLVRQLLYVYSIQDTRITPNVSVADSPLPISIAVPVGLIVNELLTNAFEHAFVNRNEGTIGVSFSVSEKGLVSLEVSDDGTGLPLGFDINAAKTLGLRLVKILTEDQLQGTLEVTGEGGATFKMEFDITDD